MYWKGHIKFAKIMGQVDFIYNFFFNFSPFMFEK